MKLIIPKEVEEKLNYYVQAVDSEIAGMGRVSIKGDVITVDEVRIYQQSVTGGTADLSSASLAKFMDELIKEGQSPKDWILWWHSHVNMAAYFSAIDTGTMATSTEYQLLISLVVNKRRERQARIDLYRPLRITMEKVDIEVPATVYTIPAEILAEVEEKVKRPVPKTIVVGQNVKSPIGFSDKKEHSGHKGPWVFNKQTNAFEPADARGTKLHWPDDDAPPIDVPPRSAYKTPLTLAEQIAECDAVITDMEDQHSLLCVQGQTDSPEAQAILDDLGDWYDYHQNLTQGYEHQGVKKETKKDKKKRAKLIKDVVANIKRMENKIKSKVLSGEGTNVSADTDELIEAYGRYSEYTGKAWSSKLAQSIDAF